MKNLIVLLAFVLGPASAMAELSDISLICDRDVQGQEGKVKISIEADDGLAQLKFADGMNPLQQLGFMNASTGEVEPILKSNLAGMDGVRIEDKFTKLTADFRIDGYDFQNKPRLGISISGAKSMELSSCSIHKDQPFNPF